MSQSPRLTFTSLAFPVEPGEDEATNPGIFGKALAHWLADELHQRGVPAGEVFAEDFGWCLSVGSKSDRLYIACASASARRGRWHVFVMQDDGWLAGLFGRRAMSDAVKELFSDVKELLQAASQVQDLHEETDAAC
jgi:hypothetical protein